MSEKAVSDKPASLRSQRLANWDDEDLIAQLRFSRRFINPKDSHSQILCEAVARILERLKP